MWKVFLVISSVVLLGAGYLSYTNMAEAKAKALEVAQQKETLDARKESIEKTNMEIAQLEQSIQMLNDETEKLETEKIDLDSKLQQAKADEQALGTQLVAGKEELEKKRVLIEDLKRVEAIQKEIAQVRVQIEEAEIEVTQMEGAAIRAKVEAERLAKVAAELKALRIDQEAGVIRGEFQSEIISAYNQWGFVVVGGGNDQGVVDRAQMDVYRRGQPICKLLVTSVEPAQTVADIIPGSLAPGQSVQVGDTVVKTVRAETPAVVVPPGGGAAAPAGGGAATTAPAAPAAEPDPFGGGGDAMGGGAAEPDPFGGSAPAQPAEPDPFGGGGAMDAGGGAAEPDPFQ